MPALLSGLCLVPPFSFSPVLLLSWHHPEPSHQASAELQAVLFLSGLAAVL
jgi:hypothetical protein